LWDYANPDYQFFEMENNKRGSVIHKIQDVSFLPSFLSKKYSSIIIIMWITDPRLLFSDVNKIIFVDFKSMFITISSN